MKKLYFLFLLIIAFQNADAQFIFKGDVIPDKISIINYSSIANAGEQNLAVEAVRTNRTNLNFNPVTGPSGNLGFTVHTYWVKFELYNRQKHLCLIILSLPNLLPIM